MARPFLYHIYHRPGFDAMPDWTSLPVVVATRVGTSDAAVKNMYSLKKDMDTLRAIGVRKGIVDRRVISLGKSAKGRRLWALKVGKGASHKVLFTGCHHAREWISVEIPYLVAEYLIKNYTDTPQTDQQKRIKHLLTNRQIWFVPLVNPDGHDYTMTADRLWRPNRKRYRVRAGSVTRPGGHVESWSAAVVTGVDINRNYATANWGRETFDAFGNVRTSRNPNDADQNSIWCGLAPSGEAETRVIDRLVRRNKFRASITYHSFSQLILCPTGSGGDAYLQWVGRGLKTLVSAFGNPYRFGESAHELYETSGSAMVFTYEKTNRPSYTPELRPNRGAPDEVQFSGLPESEIEPTFVENLGAALALINCAGHDAEARSHPLTLTTATPARCQMVRHCWEVFQWWTP